MKLSREKKIKFQHKIICWYESFGRDFLWRNTSDPYMILIAEILLQKTNVRKVEPIYLDILTKYPSVNCMAKAHIEELANIIRPLGLLNRAERLINLSKIIVQDYSGVIPSDYQTLLSFCGIGPYISTALLVFAYEKQRVVVDTNVIKVLHKELKFISSSPRPRTDKSLWEFAQSLAPENNIKEFNWGLLDYGATLN